MPRRKAASPESVHARLAVRLLSHYDTHKRDLPWRRTNDPYAIWVSEIMLQQTRVETVIPYYTRFLERFPTVIALADAPQERVMQSWSGLGYYRRARMLHAGAQAVAQLHNGTIPTDAHTLQTLPGIGRYTAGAIASIAFGLHEPVVDGNVTRVLTRIFAVKGDPARTPTREKIWSHARTLVAHDRPGDLNQALMELGASLCSPLSPHCDHCPVREDCTAHKHGATERYPETRTPKAPRTEHWVAWVARFDERFWLVPSESDRFRAMLLPPMKLRTETPALSLPDFLTVLGASRIADHGEFKHVLTHVVMRVHVFSCTLQHRPSAGLMLDTAALYNHAIPKITRRILEQVSKGG